LLLQPGVYNLNTTISFLTPGVTLLSTTGNPADVLLDGGYTNQGGNGLGEIIRIGASDITISGVSIARARWHGVHLYGLSENISNILLHNLHVYDCGQQLIKANPYGSNPNTYYVDDVVLQNSVIEFTDNSLMEPSGNGFYTGGLDVHAGLNWVVRDNIFRNISNNGALMEHAIHFWRKGRNALIERNLVINCYRGIGFGLVTTADANAERFYEDEAGDNPYRDQVGGIIRNNVVINDPGFFMDSGIALANVQGAKVFHNTVVSGHAPAPFSCVEYRWDESSQVMNNLVSHNIRAREGNNNTLVSHNLEDGNAALNILFTDIAAYDLSLSSTAAAAIDQAIYVADVNEDFARQPRGDKREIGAYEFLGVASSVSEGGGSAVPDDFFLSQNFPNPFNPTTKIVYAIPEAARIALKIYDILGKEVLRPIEEFAAAGRHAITINGDRLPAPGCISTCFISTATSYKSARCF
jgi:hypothetical protein